MQPVNKRSRISIIGLIFINPARQCHNMQAKVEMLNVGL